MDSTQIVFAILNIILLIITAYVIWKSPIEAVKIGRKLNQEQQKQDAKMDLFLTLFGQRSDPVRQNFVDGLNKINVVFYDVPLVLLAWKEYQNALSTTNMVNQDDTFKRLRINLLSEMATHLGYSEIKQTTIEEHYYPSGHGSQAQIELDLRMEAIAFLKSGNEFFQILAENAANNQLPPKQ